MWNRVLEELKRNPFVVFAACSTILFGALTAGLAYRWHFRPGWAFLVVGWMALLGAGWFLARAVMSFDLEAGEADAALAEGMLARADLEMEKSHLLKAIKEVEFDRETGKIDDWDAGEVIARYRERAIEIMRVLDGNDVTRYEKSVEEELKKRLEQAGAPPAPPPSRCRSCGLANDEDAAFCKKCGGKLGATA